MNAVETLASSMLAKPSQEAVRKRTRGSANSPAAVCSAAAQQVLEAVKAAREALSLAAASPLAVTAPATAQAGASAARCASASANVLKRVLECSAVHKKPRNGQVLARH
jgi:hypothetical protein